MARALIVLAHPDPNSFNRALAHAVRDGFAAGGAACVLRDLHAECFDPVLTAEEARGHLASDPLVRDHVRALQATDHLAVVHPNCWGAPPSMMKGWMD